MLSVKKLRKSRLRHAPAVGLPLMLIGWFMLITPPPWIRGKELLAYVCIWIGSIITVMVHPAFRIFIEHDATLRKHKRAFVGSWIYLIAGAVASIAFVILFPNWEVWTSWPMNPYSLINPYTFLAMVTTPVFILFYNLILYPEGCEEIEAWKAKRKRNPNTL